MPSYRAPVPILSGVVALFAICAATSADTSAADDVLLTERDAVAAALARPEYRVAERGRLAIAESDLDEARLLPNPIISLEREGGESTETALRLSQPLDVSGRRSLRKQAAQSRLDATGLDLQHRRLQTAAEVRLAFAEALHIDQLRDVQDNWRRRIDGAAAIVERLTSAGEASGYDRRRIERERQTAVAHLAVTHASRLRAREQLAGLIGRPETQLGLLLGNLIPGPPPAIEELRTQLAQRPDLVGLQSQVQAFEYESRAYERTRLPEVTLGLGARRIEELGGTDTGLIVGMSIPIPLFQRGQASQRRAQAQASVLRAEGALQRSAAEANLTGLWRQAEELRTAAQSFGESTLAGSRELSRIAEAAYAGGEASLLELLDAYRTEFDAEASALDLALRARRARIELDMIVGRENHD